MQHGDKPYIEPDWDAGVWKLHYMGDPPDGTEQIVTLEADLDDEESARDEAAILAGCEPEDIELDAP